MTLQEMMVSLMEGQKLLKEDMSSLKNVVETNHNKTDNQLKQLINYNKNRDNDLESDYRR